MEVRHFFDPDTFTLSYVVFDAKTKDGVIIDPVLNFDPASGEISTKSAEELVRAVKDLGLHVHYVLETHAHADHLSSSQEIKEIFPRAKIAISERILKVQDVFGKLFMSEGMRPEGGDFDYLLKDGEVLKAGSLSIRVIPAAGHTPACTALLIDDHLFTGDALFMPDSGTGRCDFPGGSAEALYDSIRRLYELPDDTKVYVGHDYQPGGRALSFITTIGESKKSNIQLKEETTKDEFISFRVARDKTLKAPRLLYPSLQVNIVAGKLPEKEKNGRTFLRIPLTGKV